MKINWILFYASSNFEFDGDFLQSSRDDVYLPGAFDLRSRSNLRLVRVLGRVFALERPQKAETLRRTLGFNQVKLFAPLFISNFLM